MAESVPLSAFEQDRLTCIGNFLRGKHREAIQLLLHDDMGLDSNWKNVSKHCVNVALIGYTLADALEIPEQDRDRLVSTLVIHDALKRVEINPGNALDDNQIQKARDRFALLLQTIDVDGTIQLGLDESNTAVSSMDLLQVIARMSSFASHSMLRMCAEISSCTCASCKSPAHLLASPTTSRSTSGTVRITIERACSRGVLPLSLLRRPPNRITFFPCSECVSRNVAISELLASHDSMSMPLCTTHVWGILLVSSALFRASLTAITFDVFFVESFESSGFEMGSTVAPPVRYDPMVLLVYLLLPMPDTCES